jgi:hypothetical protein
LVSLLLGATSLIHKLGICAIIRFKEAPTTTRLAAAFALAAAQR